MPVSQLVQLLMGLLLVGVGHTGPERDGHPVVSATAIEAAPSPDATVALDPRDQYALVEDIAAAQVSSDADPRAAFDRVRRDWQGRRVRWELRYLPALCADPAGCYLTPVDHARLAGPAAQGWLPRMQLSAPQLSELREACSPHARCVVEVQARVSELALSPELPTSLSLDDVHVVGARAVRPGESWVVRAR